MKPLKKIEFEELSSKFNTITDENLTAIVAGAKMSSIMNDTDTTNGMTSLISDTDNPIPPVTTK